MRALVRLKTTQLRRTLFRSHTPHTLTLSSHRECEKRLRRKKKKRGGEGKERKTRRALSPRIGVEQCFQPLFPSLRPPAEREKTVHCVACSDCSSLPSAHAGCVRRGAANTLLSVATLRASGAARLTWIPDFERAVQPLLHRPAATAADRHAAADQEEVAALPLVSPG